MWPQGTMLGCAEKFQTNKSQMKLLRGKDPDKDQSYFLYTLTQKQLNRVLFPLGDYKKEEVYQMAKKWKLPFRQGESFDLCFVANDTESFLKRYLKLRSGKIMNMHGKILGLPSTRTSSVLGRHQGLPLYTIGQRKNLGLAGPPATPEQAHTCDGGRGPWWVVKKDDRKNILYVSNDEKDLYGREVFVVGMNWLNGKMPKLPIKVLAKIRYKSEAAEAVINPKSKIKNPKQIIVKFKKPQRAATPGQSVVFYTKSGELLGGGVIES